MGELIHKDKLVYMPLLYLSAALPLYLAMLFIVQSVHIPTIFAILYGLLWVLLIWLQLYYIPTVYFYNDRIVFIRLFLFNRRFEIPKDFIVSISISHFSPLRDFPLSNRGRGKFEGVIRLGGLPLAWGLLIRTKGILNYLLIVPNPRKTLVKIWGDYQVDKETEQWVKRYTK